MLTPDNVLRIQNIGRTVQFYPAQGYVPQAAQITVWLDDPERKTVNLAVWKAPAGLYIPVDLVPYGPQADPEAKFWMNIGEDPTR
ncbi:MAG TPA: hypothetical protein VNU68_07150 [Verrucomicrobiae bacterium]|nr:hypothetical protein [Verrucomicrobiae bacterium]